MKQLSLALLLAAGTILAGCKSNESKPAETAPQPQSTAAPAPAPVATKPECPPEPAAKKKARRKPPRQKPLRRARQLLSIASQPSQRLQQRPKQPNQPHRRLRLPRKAPPRARPATLALSNPRMALSTARFTATFHRAASGPNCRSACINPKSSAFWA